MGWEEPNGWNLEGLGLGSLPHHSLAGMLGQALTPQSLDFLP